MYVHNDTSFGGTALWEGPIAYMFPIAGIFGLALILATPKLVACTQGRPSPTLKQHFQHFQRATCHSE